MRKAKKKRNVFIQYIVDSFKALINSFKTINVNLIFVVLADILFFTLSYGVFYFFSVLLSKKALQVQGFVNMATLEQSMSVANDLKSFILTIYVLLAVFIIFMIFNWSFSRFCIWSLILEGKIKLQNFLRFLLANILWSLAWLLPLFLAFYPLLLIVRIQGAIERPPFFPIFLISFVLVALSHFSYLFFISLIKENKIGKAFASAFRIGTVKIRFFILPYVLAFLCFSIVSLISYPLSFISQKISFVFMFILFIAYIAWLRFYLSKTVLAIK